MEVGHTEEGGEGGGHIFIRLASLGGRPQAHVHMEGMKCRVLYLNLLGMNALFL